MRTQTRGWASGWGTKARALEAGLLLVAAMLLAGAMAAGPARASTTFTVNLPTDVAEDNSSDGSCDVAPAAGGSQCTLRAAIQQANATPGADTINFAIPGTGVKTIAVGSQGLGSLPTITDPVSINGYTQPGASPNTKAVGNDAVLKVEIAGNGVGPGLGSRTCPEAA